MDILEYIGGSLSSVLCGGGATALQGVQGAVQCAHEAGTAQGDGAVGDAARDHAECGGGGSGAHVFRTRAGGCGGAGETNIEKTSRGAGFFCGHSAIGDVDAKLFEQVVPIDFADEEDDGVEKIEADKNGEQQFPFSGEDGTQHGGAVKGVDAFAAEHDDVEGRENEPFKEKPYCENTSHDIGNFAEACLLAPDVAIASAAFAADLGTNGAAGVSAGFEACAPSA